MAVSGSSWAVHFLVLCVFICLSPYRVNGVEDFLGFCGNTIDLLNSEKQSGILDFPLPESMTEYQNPQIDRKCDVTITFSHGMNLLLELYYLDIVPDRDGATGTACTTGLEVLDQTGRNVYGNRLCMEGWEWEEKHAQSNYEKKVVQSSPLIFRLESEAPYSGTGFKVHFNQFRPQYPCTNREFKCQDFQRCIHDDLTCDGWNDCGDYTDERREAGCDLLTPSEICALVIGILLCLGTIIASVLFFVTYKRLRREYGLVRDHYRRSESKSKIPLGSERMSIDTMSKRFNSLESMGTHYSRNTGGGRNRRDSDSSIDKLDLEKSDRLTLDNGSERSYRSNPKSRLRNQALGDSAPQDPIKKNGQYSYTGGRRGRASSAASSVNSVNKGEAPMRIFGIDNPLTEEDPMENDKDRDNYSNGRVTPDRRSRSSAGRRRERDGRSDYSDEDDDERRRRRRRSRSRRYSDEDDDDDYDSDYDRRRRRRRRRSYSDDDDYDSYDSEYERERRRRRRSKERERQRRSRERLENGDVDPENKENSDEERRRRRRRSRDRDRDSYDSEEEDRRRRRRRRRSASYDDDDDDIDSDRRRRRRSSERRRDRSRDRDEPDSREAERMSKALAKEVESKVPNKPVENGRDYSPPPPPPSSFRPVTPKDARPTPSPEPKAGTPPPSYNPQKERTPPREITPPRIPTPPEPTMKQPSGRSYHPPPPAKTPNRPPPITTPPTGEELQRMEADRNRRRNQIHQQRLNRYPTSPSEDTPSPPPVSIDEEDRTRRRSQDNRRERYSRDRFRGKRENPPPEPQQQDDYEDVNPRVRLDAPYAGYREETV